MLLRGLKPASLTSMYGTVATKTKRLNCNIIQGKIQNSQGETLRLLISNNDSGSHLECEKFGFLCMLYHVFYMGPG